MRRCQNESVITSWTDRQQKEAASLFAAADSPGCRKEGPSRKGSGEFDLDGKRDENRRDHGVQNIYKSCLPVILNIAIYTSCIHTCKILSIQFQTPLKWTVAFLDTKTDIYVNNRGSTKEWSGRPLSGVSFFVEFGTGEVSEVMKSNPHDDLTAAAQLQDR